MNNMRRRQLSVCRAQAVSSILKLEGECGVGLKDLSGWRRSVRGWGGAHTHGHSSAAEHLGNAGSEAQV